MCVTGIHTSLRCVLNRCGTCIEYQSLFRDSAELRTQASIQALRVQSLRVVLCVTGIRISLRCVLIRCGACNRISIIVPRQYKVTHPGPVSWLLQLSMPPCVQPAYQQIRASSHSRHLRRELCRVHFQTHVCNVHQTIQKELEYYLLIPPRESVLDPWILMVSKHHNDRSVKCTVVKIPILDIPCSLRGDAESCLIISV